MLLRVFFIWLWLNIFFITIHSDNILYNFHLLRSNINQCTANSIDDEFTYKKKIIKLQIAELQTDKKNSKKNKDLILDDEIIKRATIFGDVNSKNTIIELSSPTCVHCSEYHQKIFPLILHNLIQKKIIRYIYIPIPTDEKSLDASIMTKCVAQNNSKIMLDIMDVLYRSNESFLFGNHLEKIGVILKINGFDAKRINYCKNGKKDDYAKNISETGFNAFKKFNLNFLPTIIVNGKKVIPENLSYKGIINMLNIKNKESLYNNK